MWKRVFTALLFALLSASLVLAAGQGEKAGKAAGPAQAGALFSTPVTLKALISENASWPFRKDWYILDVIKRKTNISFDVTAVGTGYSAKLNLIMASGDLPDFARTTSATVINLFKTLLGLFFLLTCNALSKKFSDTSLWDQGEETAMSARRIRDFFTPFQLATHLVVALVVFTTLYPFLNILAVSLSANVHVMKNEVTFYPRGLTFLAYSYVLQNPKIFRAYLNSIWAVIIPYAVSIWNMLIMRAFFHGFPSELVDSGNIDGLNDVGILVSIVLPLSKAVLATIGLFDAVSFWNTYFAPLIYLNAPEKYPLQLLLRQILLLGEAFSDRSLNVADAAVVDTSLKYATVIVSTLPILLIYPFMQKHFVKGVMLGSVKG